MANNTFDKIEYSNNVYLPQIPFVVGPSTDTTAGAWTGTISGIDTLADGLIILYKPAVAGATTTQLNLNGLGNKTVYLNNTTKLTTHFPKNQPILLAYSTSQNSGCWMAIDNYTDGNTKNSAGTTNKVGEKMFIVGATSQAANPTTYSNVNVYIGTDNCLYSNGTKVATVTDIANLPTPMQFKGSVGTGGTVTSLPAAADSTGYVYKVITALNSPSAKVGDTVISNGSEWVVIPSGDEPSGTVTSVKVEGKNGLTGSGTVTTSGTITISHAAGSGSSSSNSGRTYIQSVTLDSYGHVTGLTTGTETVSNTDTKVNMVARGTTKSYLLGTTASPTSSNQAVSSVAETGVYLETSNSATRLIAPTFVGNLTGTASGNLTSSSILDATKLSGTIPSSCYTDTNTTYTLSGALASHKFTSTLTASGSGSGTSTSDFTLAAGTGITITDDTSTRKMTIACNVTNTDTKVNVTLGTTTKAYLLGTSTEPTGTATAVTAISDTNVYLDTTAGTLTATNFNGKHSGLTLTAATTGFTIAGGTTSKTLTVSGTYTLAAACAKAVDTSISAASTSTNLPTSQAVAAFVEGKNYLTSHQTIKQDGVTGATGNHFGTCSTAAGTAAKTVSITSGEPTLEAGLRVTVKFTNANTASTPTLNVNSKGAKNIFHNGTQITTGVNKALLAGTVEFVYDGTQWQLVGNYINTTYTIPTAAANNTTNISIADHDTTTVGSASNWNAGSASNWTFEEISIPNVIAAGSGSYSHSGFSGGSGSFSATVTDHVLSFSHTHTAAVYGTDSHTHTAPTIGTAIKVQSKSGGGNGTKPSLTVTPTTVVNSETHSITDNGHTHTLS